MRRVLPAVRQNLTLSDGMPVESLFPEGGGCIDIQSTPCADLDDHDLKRSWEMSKPSGGEVRMRRAERLRPLGHEPGC